MDYGVVLLGVVMLKEEERLARVLVLVVVLEL